MPHAGFTSERRERLIIAEATETVRRVTATAGCAVHVAVAATAATQPAAAHARASVRALAAGKRVTVTAAPAATCSPGQGVQVGLYNGSSYGPPFGYEVCGTREISAYNASTGHWESFVIGTNYSMWHTWTGQSKWYNMGGGFCDVGYTGQPCGVYGSGSYPNITVGGYGPQKLQEWCSTRQNNGTWSAWYKCG
jgi:hypothetical protein